MDNENNSLETTVNNARNLAWLDDLESLLPDTITESKRNGKLPDELTQAAVSLGIREWPNGKEYHFKARLSDLLLDVLIDGADTIGKPVLPPSPAKPFDALRNQHGHNWSDPLDLNMPLWLALATGSTRHFGIEYKLTVQINAKWGVAEKPSMTSRDLLTLFGFDPAEFSLYRVNSADVLPPDQPLDLKRGDRFEAQKDGKYGFVPRVPPGLQTFEQDFAAIQQDGVDIRKFSHAGQTYVEVCELDVPSPPWSSTRANILIAIPATYPSGGLDAFYLELTINQYGTVPYKQADLTIDGRNWGLISWHYADGHHWNPTRDDLASHIAHCHGFFLKRGIR